MLAIVAGSMSSMLVCLASENMASMSTSKQPTTGADRNTLVNVYLLLSLLYCMITVAHRLLDDVFKSTFEPLLVSGLCCCLVIMASDLLVKFEIFLNAGNVFFHRIFQVKHNWCTNPQRSLVELSLFFVVLAASYAVTKDPIFSSAFSVGAGITIVLASHVFHKNKANKNGALPSKFSEAAKKQLHTILQTKYKNPMLPRHLKVKAPLLKKQEVFTMKQVATHNKEDDAWVVYDGKVFNLSKFMHVHPGGKMPILRFAGMDATDEIRAFHMDNVLADRMPNFQIGTVSDPIEPSQTQKDFRQLMAYAVENEFYTRDLSFYVSRLVFQFSLLGLVWALVICTDSLVLHMAAAVLLGGFFQQMAFLGHDCGHLAVFHESRADNLFGLFVGPLFTGVGVLWWKNTHNTHHAVPNSVVDDPDIAHLPVFAVSSKMFGDLFHTYHQRIMPFDWIARNVLVPNQHLLFYPVMGLARFNLYLQSMIQTFKSRSRQDIKEFVCQLFFFSWLYFLCSFLGSGKEKWAFLFLSHAVAGMLNVQICLSHFSMPVNDGKEDAKGAYGGDFYTRNVLSSMDVVCSKGMDW